MTIGKASATGKAAPALLVLLTLPVFAAASCRRPPSSAPASPAPASPVSTSPPPASTTVTQADDRGNSRLVRWSWTDGWRRWSLDARGNIELTDDERDVKSVSPNGYFELASRGWLSLGGGPRYIVRAGADGTLSRRFMVSGQDRPIDDAARQWIGDQIERLARRGFDADQRVARILAQQGVVGVLAEIPGLSGDFIKAEFFTLLFKQATIAGPTAQRTLRSVSRDIGSDHQRASVLIAFARTVVVDETIAPAFADATISIDSDFEHARVLRALLEGPTATPAVLRAALVSSRALRSDFEKGRVLAEVVQNDGVDASTRDLFFGAVQSIPSDFQRARVLSALAGREGLGQDTVLGILRSTAGMGSDFEKARVLLEVIAVQPLEGATRQALIDTAGGLGSDHERGRVLSALFRR